MRITVFIVSVFVLSGCFSRSPAVSGPAKGMSPVHQPNSSGIKKTHDDNHIPAAGISVHPFVTKMESGGFIWEEMGLQVKNTSDRTFTVDKTYLFHEGSMVGINYYSYSVSPSAVKVHDMVHFDSNKRVYSNGSENDLSWKKLTGTIEVRLISSEGETASGFLKR
jgi:hypothetical protein